MNASADLVVVATPVAVRDTGEKTMFENSAVPAVRLEATFTTQVVFKGEAKTSIFVLSYFRRAPLPNGTEMLDGYSLVTFSTGSNVRYLMFLKKTADGKYVPVGGQKDPAFNILKLEGSW